MVVGFQKRTYLRAVGAALSFYRLRIIILFPAKRQLFGNILLFNFRGKTRRLIIFCRSMCGSLICIRISFGYYFRRKTRRRIWNFLPVCVDRSSAWDFHLGAVFGFKKRTFAWCLSWALSVYRHKIFWRRALSRINRDLFMKLLRESPWAPSYSQPNDHPAGWKEFSINRFQRKGRFTLYQHKWIIIWHA